MTTETLDEIVARLAQKVFAHLQGNMSATFGWQGSDPDSYTLALKAHDQKTIDLIAADLRAELSASAVQGERIAISAEAADAIQRDQYVRARLLDYAEQAVDETAIALVLAIWAKLQATPQPVEDYSHTPFVDDNGMIEAGDLDGAQPAIAQTVLRHEQVSALLSVAITELKKVNELLSVLDQPPSAAMQPLTCAWTEQDDDDMPGTYESACGETWSFVDGGVAENNICFCHGCGKPVEVRDIPKAAP